MDGEGKTVFVIDDEEPIRKVLNAHLSRHGYGVILSSGGASVMEELSASSFDLVICDIRMPGIDGIRVLEGIKERFDTVPVIMLTGFTDISIAIEVMKKGAFDYLMKPVNRDDLLASVEKALAQGELLKMNKALTLENLEYQRSLEEKVRERTRELDLKALELQSAYGLLKNMNVQFINVLAETIEAKDRLTRGHCNRMRRLCIGMGSALGLTGGELETLEYASLLHDLGKIAVSESILNKEGPLDIEESARIREHAEVGGRILSRVPMMEAVSRIVLSHHENFDGTGYPRRLKGPEIPLPARIIAIADLYDAMSSDRPYRKGLPIDTILEEMKRVSGTQLDPALVKVFIEKRLYLIEMR